MKHITISDECFVRFRFLKILKMKKTPRCTKRSTNGWGGVIKVIGHLGIISTLLFTSGF